jgi:F0F1-type ATP synthase delta subunit
MYNLLLEQARHNESIKKKEIEAKLSAVRAKALEHFNKINNEVDSDEAVIKNFLDLIIQHQMTALCKDLIKKFNKKMYAVDAEIKKADVIIASNRKFEEAVD